MKKILALLVAIMMLAMTIPALAEAPAAEETPIPAEFVPSIEGKPAPGLVDVVKFYLADGTTKDVAAGELVITPLADIYDVTKTVDPETVALLTWAYESLQEGEDILVIKADIDAALEGTELTFEDLVARDLFEVSAYGDLAKWLEEEGTSVEFILDAIFAENQTVVVLYAAHAEEPVWQVLANPDVWSLTEAVEEICNIGMKTGDLGVFAFMVVAEGVAPVVTSPAN